MVLDKKKPHNFQVASSVTELE